MTDEELFALFDNAGAGIQILGHTLLSRRGLLDAKKFTHEMHVRVGWIYACRYSRAEAIIRFADRLKFWTRIFKMPEKYHETITWFYMLIICERQSLKNAESFDTFIAQNPDLIAKPSILGRYYKAETLASDRAKKQYLLPDNLKAA